jgi:hypothetical protein
VWVGLSRSAEVGGLSQTGGHPSFVGTPANGEVAPKAPFAILDRAVGVLFLACQLLNISRAI